jgi:hypothetical protein
VNPENQEWLNEYNQYRGKDMAIVAEAGSSGSFQEPPLGTHLARCYQIIDLGTQQSEWQGESFIKHQVLVSWEIPSQLMDDGRPISASKFYTLSLHEKSNLGKDLVSWRGKAFTPEEEAGFDISKLLGVPCMLSVIKKNDKSKVGTVMGLPAGTTPPEAVNPTVLFDLQEYMRGETTVFDGLSEGLQRIILKAKELTNVSDEPAGGLSGVDPNDDIPF